MQLLITFSFFFYYIFDSCVQTTTEATSSRLINSLLNFIVNNICSFMLFTLVLGTTDRNLTKINA